MNPHLLTLITPQVREHFQITDDAYFLTCATSALNYFNENYEERLKFTDEIACIPPYFEIIDPTKIQKNTIIPGTHLTTPCGFIDTRCAENPEGGIYAMAVKELAKGCFGKVKLGLRLDRPDPHLYTIKKLIQSNNPVIEKIQENEQRVGLAQGFFAHPKLTRLNAGKKKENKHYFVAKHAGISLDEWLKKEQPSHCTRIHVAICLCIKVNDLHQHYVHRDLKSDNVLIDPKTLEVTLIDYGFSCDKTVSEISLAGSPFSLPLQQEEYQRQPLLQERNLTILHQRMNILGLIGIDTFAICRILSAHSIAKPTAPSLLSDETISALGDLIHTSGDNIDYAARRDVTLLQIAAHLILLLYPNIPAPSELNSAACQRIVDTYKYEQLPMEANFTKMRPTGSIETFSPITATTSSDGLSSQAATPFSPTVMRRM